MRNIDSSKSLSWANISARDMARIALGEKETECRGTQRSAAPLEESVVGSEEIGLACCFKCRGILLEALTAWFSVGVLERSGQNVFWL